MTHIDPTPTKPTKAIVGAVSAGIVAAGTALIAALSDNSVSPAEIITAVLAFIVGAGLTGGTVFATTNAPKTN